jgi:hypothetical protein
MKPIKVKQIYYHINGFYRKANTKTQRALLGYIIKAGFADHPIYGGAFDLVREIESYTGIYVLETRERPEVAMEIIKIAERAMLGWYDDFAFSEREINIIIAQLGNLKGKGGK